MVAVFLWTLYGWPVRMMRLATILCGSLPTRVPLPTKLMGKSGSSSCLKMRTGVVEPKVTGMYTLPMFIFPGRR
jgi:hypothetical protein